MKLFPGVLPPSPTGALLQTPPGALPLDPTGAWAAPGPRPMEPLLHKISKTPLLNPSITDTLNYWRLRECHCTHHWRTASFPHINTSHNEGHCVMSCSTPPDNNSRVFYHRWETLSDMICLYHQPKWWNLLWFSSFLFVLDSNWVYLGISSLSTREERRMRTPIRA